MRTLFHSGTIRTMVDIDDAPEAVVVEDGRILFAGPRAEAVALIGEDHAEVDLEGRTLMPSFIDPHGHFLLYGQFAAMVDLSEASSVDEIVGALSERLSRREGPGSAPLVGVNYDHNFLREGRHPNRDDLDRVSATVPIVVMHASVHLGVGNSAVLELAGVTEDTPDPEGGRFGRRPGGTEPDGYAEEMSAIAAFTTALADGEQSMQLIPGAAQNPAEAIRRAQDEYLRHGITTVQEGAAGARSVNDLIEAGGEGRLALDVVAYPVINHGGPECVAEHPEHAAGYRDHVRIGGYKMILDGSPQGRSAWLSTPYEEDDAGGEADAAETGPGDAAEDVPHCDCGYPALPDHEVEDWVRLAVSQRRQLLAHCNGDAASEQFITAMEAVQRDHPDLAELRPVMIHAQTVRADQLDRMPGLGMIASFFCGHVYYWGDVHLRNLGPRRGRFISPARAALDRGVGITLHQDAPVTPPDMALSLWAAVNRVSRSGRPVGLDQRITTWEALQAVTSGAAYQYGEEAEKGRIQPGMRADLIVVSQDPVAMDPARLRELEVEMTLKDGEVVYSA
ncbi:amidohydrolase [Rothia halotolerans]|uniref:amidohydrolase n=1 Tax=Rothia halotolerans TaxID=405770 RepID=UPI00101D9E7A|nr:amidohydrolase [Rothia halotolerans]